jgi:hypothetical protein
MTTETVFLFFFSTFRLEGICLTYISTGTRLCQPLPSALHPCHHVDVHLYLRLIQYEFHRRQRPGVAIHRSECTPAVAYSRRYSVEHLDKGCSFLEQSEAESALRLCRETFALHPGSPELIQALADAIYWTTEPRVSDLDLDEAISLYLQALSLRPPADES